MGKKINKYTAGSVIASLAVPIANVDANEVGGNDRLFGTPFSLYKNYPEQSFLSDMQLLIDIRRFTEDSEHLDSLYNSARLWRDVLTDEELKVKFLSDPSKVLTSYGYSDVFSDDSIFEVNALRAILSPQVIKYAKSEDHKNFIIELMNMGVMDSDYSGLVDTFKDQLKNPELKKILESREGFNETDLTSFGNLLLEAQMSGNRELMAVVAFAVIAINAAFMLNVYAVSNIYSAIAVATDALAFSNSTAWSLPHHPEDPLANPDDVKMTMSETNYLDMVSSLNRKFKNTEEIVLMTSRKVPNVHMKNIEMFTKIKIRAFLDAMSELGMVSLSDEELDTMIDDFAEIILHNGHLSLVLPKRDI